MIEPKCLRGPHSYIHGSAHAHAITFTQPHNTCTYTHMSIHMHASIRSTVFLDQHRQCCRHQIRSKMKEFLPKLYSSCVMVRTVSAASCIASLKGFDERMQQAVRHSWKPRRSDDLTNPKPHELRHKRPSSEDVSL